MSRVNLLLKLTVDRDRRTNKGEVQQHSVKHALGVYSENLRKMLLMNLVYAFLFSLPFLFCVFILPDLMKDYFFTHYEYNFMGHVGIGYPGVWNTMSEGYTRLYDFYFKCYIPLLSASIVPMVFGLAGLFHCLRGYMWGENVRPVKSFFRGIKRLWKPFLLTAILFAGFMCGILYGIFWHISLLKTTGATGGSWVLFIFLILLGWFGVGFMYFLLPTFACYRFKLRDAFKNSGILLLVLWFPTLFAAALAIGVFLLSLVGSFLNYLLIIFFLAIGFVFIAGIWTSGAQKAFGNYIQPQFESSQSGGKIKVESRRGVNPYREAKAKKKAQENTAVGKASLQRAGENVVREGTPAPEKKKKVATKRVSYKRKK